MMLRKIEEKAPQEFLLGLEKNPTQNALPIHLGECEGVHPVTPCCARAQEGTRLHREQAISIRRRTNRRHTRGRARVHTRMFVCAGMIFMFGGGIVGEGEPMVSLEFLWGASHHDSMLAVGTKDARGVADQVVMGQEVLWGHMSAHVLSSGD